MNVMHGNGLDLVLLVTIAVFAVTGYRRGFVIGLLSFVGFFGCALLGLQLAPLVADKVTDTPGRVAVALTIVFALAIAGQTIAFVVGARIRDHIRAPGLRAFDGVGGSVFSALAVVLVAWIVAAPLASAPTPWLASQVRNSALLRTIDKAMPDQVQPLYSTFQDAIRSNDFPPIFNGLGPTKAPEIRSPDPALASLPVVAQAHRSVVKVAGDAPSCSRQITGSGFVYAEHRVMTNAHVVAGVRAPTVEAMGRQFTAHVVVYDPERDLAVLDVPALNAPVMPFATDAQAGDDAIILGYPLGGPYTAAPARIREKQQINGPDIYQDNTINREVYSVRGEIKPGNSGGPLIDTHGRVYGVIFAAATDDADTGYALTAAEVATVADEGQNATAEVGTQGCD